MGSALPEFGNAILALTMEDGSTESLVVSQEDAQKFEDAWDAEEAECYAINDIAGLQHMFVLASIEEVETRIRRPDEDADAVRDGNIPTQIRERMDS